ncbi:hypothetical protein ACED34_20340 [Vibrio splendidus]|uniref:Primosomal replication protein PriB/PriC domain protein n=1 Tax=Vibrio splendidus TaxID=29497 RepID=A0A0H3ZKA5_VIBSP|nr:hypothetical protein [Vibrio splendidus]
MTLAQVQALIDAYYQAELDLLAGKTVTFQGRTVTSENLSEIRKGRHEMEQRKQTLLSGRSRHSPSLARFE